MRAVLLLGVLALAAFGIVSAGVGAASSDAVDVALVLVLVIDCSASVDGAEFRMQIDGLAKAFDSPDVAEIIAAGPHQQVAVAILEFAGAGKSVVVQPWMVVGDAAPVADVAAAVRRVTRRTGGVTSISDALAASIALLSQLPYRTARQTVDISTDGYNNDGPRPDGIRDRAVALGIVVNGLTILSDVRNLDVYFRQHVMGGQGSFVEKTKDYRDYEEAIKRKLLRELAQPIT